jgi:hypothetical protein
MIKKNSRKVSENSATSTSPLKASQTVYSLNYSAFCIHCCSHSVTTSFFFFFTEFTIPSLTFCSVNPFGYSSITSLPLTASSSLSLSALSINSLVPVIFYFCKSKYADLRNVYSVVLIVLTATLDETIRFTRILYRTVATIDMGIWV